MERNYVDGMDYELVFKLKDSEERRFFGTLTLIDNRKVGNIISLYSLEELQRLGRSEYTAELCPVIPNGDITVSIKDGCALIEKDGKILDMIRRDAIEEIITYIEGKRVD